MLKSLLAASLCISSALASEIDSFTLRYEPLTDSAEVINERANVLLGQGVDDANQTPGCHNPSLYKSLRKRFNSIHKDGELIEFILQSPSVFRHTPLRRESIFRHHRLVDGQILARPSADRGGFGMGSTLKFQEHYIGSDKFEHMFGQGFKYFENYHLKKKPLANTLKLGIFIERTILGGNPLATGVFSFADLVANFQGMRFWNHILQESADVLQEDLGPYVTCSEGMWVMVKKINFKDYVDAGFDEGQNCLSLATSHATRGVLAEIDSLESRAVERRYSCPIDSAALENAKKRYEVLLPEDSRKQMIGDLLFNPWGEIRQYKGSWKP
ncbi:MAG: hypothetical protein LW878_11735 [Proteobacteria bacterium]|jgi:hypothetical protein|nr:hypothetical protein [Pseudomonadota bacterium]